MLRFFLIYYLFSAILFSAYALDVTLSNGASYSGEIIAENDQSYTIKLGETPVTILKKMIVAINGKPVADSPASLSQSKADSSLQAPDYKGKKLSLTLKNGMVFQGTMISDNGKIVVLNRDGAPVNIYRSTIARIDIVGAPLEQPYTSTVSDTLSTESNKSDDHQQDELTDKKIPVVSVSQFDNDQGQSVQKFSNNRIDAIRPLVKSSSSDAIPQQSAQNITGIVPVDTHSVESGNVAPTLPVVEVASLISQIDTLPKSTQKGIVPPIVSGIKIPKTNVYIPPARTRSDGKKEIVLKNGTVFQGKILSENERFISFDSDGASMNILKKLIKEIDGVEYIETVVSKKKILPKVQNDSIRFQHSVPFSGKRLSPVVEIPPGMTSQLLIDSLKSPVWENRSAACRMLGAMGQWAYSAVNYCSALLSDTAQMRVNVPVWLDSADVQRLLAPSLEAARALAYLGEEGYRVLKEALNSPEVLVRKSAVFGLLEFSDDVEKEGVLVQILKDREPSVRALALGGFCTPQGEHYLLTALNDNESQVRSNAAFLLGKLGSKNAIPQLMRLLEDNRSLVRAYAVEALGQIGDVKANNTMLSLLDDPNFMVREKAASALGYLQDTVAIWSLIDALRDVSPDVRAAAATALSYLRDPRAIPSLYSLLRDDNLIVRERARESLRLHTELTQLIEALTDANDTVRENAAYVLWLLTGKDFGDDPEKWLAWYKAEKTVKNK